MEQYQFDVIRNLLTEQNARLAKIEELLAAEVEEEEEAEEAPIQEPRPKPLLKPVPKTFTRTQVYSSPAKKPEPIQEQVSDEQDLSEFEEVEER